MKTEQKKPELSHFDAFKAIDYTWGKNINPEAVPDLLRELKRAMEIIRGEYPPNQLNEFYAFDRMEAAIKKAEIK